MTLTDDEIAFYDALAANESAVRALGVTTPAGRWLRRSPAQMVG